MMVRDWFTHIHFGTSLGAILTRSAIRALVFAFLWYAGSFLYYHVAPRQFFFNYYGVSILDVMHDPGNNDWVIVVQSDRVVRHGSTFDYADSLDCRVPVYGYRRIWLRERFGSPVPVRSREDHAERSWLFRVPDLAFPQASVGLPTTCVIVSRATQHLPYGASRSQIFRSDSFELP